MAKHLPTTVWHTRLGTEAPYQTVRTHDGKTVIVGFMPGKKMDGWAILLSRKDARLLARRINQCLDHTATT